MRLQRQKGQRITLKNRAALFRVPRSYFPARESNKFGKETELVLVFQSENESNDEDYARSPVLLDLDENSKQQQRKIANREANSPNSVSAVQNQRLQEQVFAGTREIEFHFTNHVKIYMQSYVPTSYYRS